MVFWVDYVWFFASVLGFFLFYYFVYEYVQFMENEVGEQWTDNPPPPCGTPLSVETNLQSFLSHSMYPAFTIFQYRCIKRAS